MDSLPACIPPDDPPSSRQDGDDDTHFSNTVQQAQEQVLPEITTTTADITNNKNKSPRHDPEQPPPQQDIVLDESTPAQLADASHTPQESLLHNDNSMNNNTSASAAETSSSGKLAAQGSSSSFRQPLPLLTPRDTPLPTVSSFNLFPQQLKQPLFVAIARVLVVYGNAWQSAPELVDGIRLYGLVTLRGNTPKSTVQGAISTALSLSHTLKTFEPIEKRRAQGTTYYRMAPKALDPALAQKVLDSDATESDSISTTTRKRQSGSSSLARSVMTRPKARVKAPTTNTKRKQKLSSDTSIKSKKRKPISGWASDTLSSGSSDDDSMVSADTDRQTNGRTRRKSTTDTRKGSSSSNTSRPKPPARKDSIPNGLKKLPKGYVYDTEINQSALMNLSVNPSQTGEYMQHLKGKNALENDYPDRRGEFRVDLTQEPSTFAHEQQTGYTYPRLRNSRRERLPKADCEDGYAITDLKHKGAFLGRMFCLTDGHGGRACSSFVIATIPGAMQVIFEKYRPQDLSLPNVQELLRSQISEAVRLIDKEYLEYKKQQYLLYKEKKITQDPGSDGTTLIVNIFIDKWIICLNLGDSRSLLSSRDGLGRWNVEFHSEDHTPALERLALTIYANGGEFVTHDDKVIRFDPNLRNDKKHRQSLKEARIRVRDGASNEYGIPYRTKNGQAASVNLGACIGDVLYKLDPANPVLSCKPDITFIDISNIQQGFLLMASDGLWDYVQKNHHRTQDQNLTVSQFVGDKVDRGWNHQRIVHTLADRESSAGLYSDSIQEYDDFTAILVTFGKQQLIQQQQRNQELEEKQLLLQQQRLQEQFLLEQKLRDVEMIRLEQANLLRLEARQNGPAG
ncbi:Protein phosphatase 1L [Linnemannia elongata]|nr:Protein phosphatase 1L [Linnemannia elongata]